MITTTSLYQAEAASLNRKPIYRAKFYGNYVGEVMADAPSGFWRLNDTNAVALDLSGNSLSGAYNGGYTQSEPGPFVFDDTDATLFNGTTGYVSVADADLLDPGDVFTLEAWVNPLAIGSTLEVLAKDTNGYQLQIYTDGTIRLIKYGVSVIVASLITVVANRWVHIVATKSGSTVHLYINGVDVTGAVTNATILATASALNIGRDQVPGSYFSGYLANVAIYPTALSAVRVLAHYDCGMDVLFPEEYSTHPIHTNYADEVLADGPSGYWRFNSGTVTDSSGNGLTGAYFGGVVLVAGALTGDSDKAYDFNGTNGYVTVLDNNLLDDGDVFSLEAWIYHSAASKGQILSKGMGAYDFEAHENGYLRLNKDTTNQIAISSSVMSLNTWYHVMATKNGSDVHLYINGVDVTGAVTNFALVSTTTDLNIGRGYSGISYFSGSIDEVAIYAFPISAARVRAHYDAGKLNFYRRDVSDYMVKSKIGASQVIPERGQCSVGPLTFVLNDQADYDSEIMADAPSMYLALNELKGQLAYDGSGNAMSGIYHGSPQFGQKGPIAYGPDWATHFNGIDQYVGVANDTLLNPGDVFSLECLFSLSGGGATQILLDKGVGGYEIVIDSTPIIYLTKSGVANIATTTIAGLLSLNTWYHLLITKNGASFTIYLNGVDVTDRGLYGNQTIVSTTDQLGIGATSGGVTAFLNGSLARVAIYPTALSAARALAHYQASLARPGDSRNGSNGSITRLISQRLSGQVCVFSMGFDAITEENYAESVFRGIVDSNPQTADLSGYDFTINDPQTLLNVQVFDPANTTLAVALTSGAATAYIRDDTGFDVPGYIVVDSEIMSYTGKSTNHGIAPFTVPSNTVYGNGFFVGNNATATGVNDIWYSSDGKNWYSSSSGVSGTQAFFFGNGKHIALSQSTGFGAYSTDGGKTWSVPFAISNKVWKCGCWASGLSKFVALSSNDFVITSADGITWAAAAAMAPSGGTSPGGWAQILWDSGTALLVACSAAGGGSTRAIVTSVDASAFVLRVTAASSVFTYLMSSGSLFVAGGPNFWATSTDAVTWTSQTGVATNAGVYCPDLALFVTAGNTNKVATTANGVAWTTQTGPTGGGNWLSVATNSAGVVIITGGTNASNDVGYSVNATAWNIFTSQLTGLTRGVLLSTAAAHSAGVAIQEMIRIGPGHPVDLFLNIAQRTDKVGAGIPSTLLDLVAMAAVKAAIGASYQMEWRITAAANFMTWSQTEFFQALAMFPIRSSGKYSIKMIDAISAVVDSIDEDSVAGPFQIRWDDNFKNSVINEITVFWDYDVAAKLFATSQKFPAAGASTAMGHYPVPPIQSHGFRSELPGTIDMITAAMQTRLIGRYGFGVPVVTARAFASKNVLESGDDIHLTSTLVPNSDGTRGVTDAPVQVTEISHDLGSGYSDVKVMWPDW